MKYRNVSQKIPVQGEKKFGVSQCVPDQALTMREIFDRFAYGTIDDINLRSEKEAIYSEDLPDLRGRDMVEMEEYSIKNRQDITDLEHKLKPKGKPTTPIDLEPIEPTADIFDELESNKP